MSAVTPTSYSRPRFSLPLNTASSSSLLAAGEHARLSQISPSAMLPLGLPASHSNAANEATTVLTGRSLWCWAYESGLDPKEADQRETIYQLIWDQSWVEEDTLPLVVIGDLYLIGFDAITRLPDGLRATGSLHLSGLACLTALPKGMQADDGIELSELPSHLNLEHSSAVMPPDTILPAELPRELTPPHQSWELPKAIQFTKALLANQPTHALELQMPAEQVQAIQRRWLEVRQCGFNHVTATSAEALQLDIDNERCVFENESYKEIAQPVVFPRTSTSPLLLADFDALVPWYVAAGTHPCLSNNSPLYWNSLRRVGSNTLLQECYHFLNCIGIAI